jgi:hypothetical protein
MVTPTLTKDMPTLATVVSPGPALVGLCADCRHSRVVKSERSTFYLCERALTDPRFRKYPPLPVLACPGYERRVDTDKVSDDPGPDGKLTG